MKYKLLYILPVLAVLFGFTACSSDDDITDIGQNTELTGDDVIVKAGIGANSVFTRSNPIGTTEEQAKFNEGDIINVYSPNSQVRGVYKLTNGAWVDYSNSDTYKTSQNSRIWKSLKWNTDVMSFYALYPLEDIAYSVYSGPPGYWDDTYYYCKIKTDQSKVDALEKSDFMFAKAIDVTKPANHTVTFNFERQTARVIVKLSYNNQFDGQKPTVGSLSVYGGNFIGAGAIAITGLDSYDKITPYKKQDNEYVALVCPRDGKTDQTFLEMTINHDADANGKTSTDLTLTGTQTLEKGKSYTFNVTVGKEKLTIESVSVSNWTDGGALPEGEAEQVYS